MKKPALSLRGIGRPNHLHVILLGLPALIANEVDAIQISAVALIDASLGGFIRSSSPGCSTR